MTGLAATVLADTWPYHHNLGTGGWIAMMFGMVIFWGAVIAFVGWLVRGGFKDRRQTPEEALRQRLADGSISVEEYEQRRTALDDTSRTPAGQPTTTSGHE